MEDYQMRTPSIWSTLSTVQNIDMDLDVRNKDIVAKTGELYRTNAKSLFIESLVDQLCKLLEKDPYKRRKVYDAICGKLHEMKLVDKTYQLEELSSLRGYYQNAMMQLLRAPNPGLHKMPSYNFEWSRYSNEYEEVDFIAAGGFGKVFKVKHRLDQAFYAVKKISVKFKNIPMLIMESNEVKTLAKLNHPNIVQYKAAWLEPVFNVSPPALPIADASQHNSSESDEIVFQASDSTFLSDDDNSSSVCKQNENNLLVCKYTNDCNGYESSHPQQISATLYVSMELCDENLREWLIKRNGLNQPVDLKLCMNIMIEATKGLEYIHSCNIVHHDIKSSNIFLSNNLRSIQVGDFGLACCIQGHNHSSCPLEGGRFGTRLYAAPEQHKGQCNIKSDMYSLGLVFIELVTVFATEMERISVLTKARSGDIPSTVPEVLVPIIKQLISPLPDDRPSSAELLAMLRRLLSKPRDVKAGLSITKTQVISFNEKKQADSTKDFDSSLRCDLIEILKDKDKEISELKSMLAKRDSEIERLKQCIIKECL